MAKRKTQVPDIQALLQGGFSEEIARQLYAQGEEIAIFVMLQLAALALKTQQVNGTHPSEPSAAVATYLKEPGKKRKRRPGAKPGHKGSRLRFIFCAIPANIVSGLTQRRGSVSKTVFDGLTAAGRSGVGAIRPASVTPKTFPR